jgi:hypothetical protein
MRLVDLLNGWAVVVCGTAGSASRHSATGHTAGHATLTTSSVELHHDGVGNTLKLLLLGLVLVLGGGLVVVQPGNSLVCHVVSILMLWGVDDDDLPISALSFSLSPASSFSSTLESLRVLRSE